MLSLAWATRLFETSHTAAKAEVVLGQQFLGVIDVCVQALTAHADEANGDPVICANNAAGGRRLALPVNRGLKQAG